jgi:fatty-acyl-CoA synthase
VPGQRFDGYADAEATEAKILRDVLRPGDQWFRTGDLLRQDEDGDFFFVDRIGDTFRWKGENVSTDEVTAALRAVVDIGDVAVFGVEIPGHEGRAGMAAVTGAPLDPVALYVAVATLPSHARPAFIRQMSTLGRTATHKIQLARLREEGFDDARCGGDALWIRDDAQGKYVPLTAALRARIADGTLRL